MEARPKEYVLMHDRILSKAKYILRCSRTPLSIKRLIASAPHLSITLSLGSARSLLSLRAEPFDRNAELG